MKHFSTFVLLIPLLLSACSEAPPTYELVIGEEVTLLPVHDDANLIRDDIMAHIKPLWNDLETGDSITFHTVRTTTDPLDDDIKSAFKEKFGEGAAITMSTATSSPPMRFFKNREGRQGVEQVDSQLGNLALFSGAEVTWSDIERYLRHRLDDDRIQLLIQTEKLRP